MNTIETYEAYASKIGDRKKIYERVQKNYGIQSALYPGSHIDIAPSFFMPKVTYIDNFKGAIKFFRDRKTIHEYIQLNKTYEKEAEIQFVGEDYSTIALDVKYDLIISQYAGFVGQYTKKFLKAGGYLLCNDSHGDATLAYFDEAFEFVGVLDGDKITSLNLHKYFKLKGDKKVDIEDVKKNMKGPKYSHPMENYIFRFK